MWKYIKKIYRTLAWVLSSLFAAGMLSGCIGMYGPPPKPKSNTPPPSGYNETLDLNQKG
jgi:hypothetical protein